MIDFSRMLGDSFEYTREALWERWNRWVILIISIIIFPLILGYLMQILREGEACTGAAGLGETLH